jgi:tartrate-resistant acid phosphatase type 5
MAAGLNNEYMALCLILMISSFGLCLVSTHAELRRFEQPAKTDGTLSFLVLGDWGRKGAFNQSEVALQVLPTSLLFFNLHHVFVCVCACMKGVGEKS